PSVALGLGNICIDTPWGATLATRPAGTFFVCWIDPAAFGGCQFNAGAGTTPYFGIYVTNLSKSACMNLANRAANYNGPTGLAYINFNGNVGVGPAGTNIGPIIAANPIITPTLVRTNCTGPGTPNTLTLVYQLRLPTT